MSDGDDQTPSFSDVPVAGGDLRVASWGRGERVVLGVHGITGSSMQLAPVARRLGPSFTLVAPDLRGRGGSNRLPPPFGVRSHVDDCAAVVRHFSSWPVVVLGESLGAFVAVLLAASWPDLVDRLVLADGGVPTAVDADVDLDVVLQAVIGPAIARLGQVFPTPGSYLDFWRAHPAVSEEWNADVEAYLNYDLESAGAGYVSRARTEAVRSDGADILADSDAIATALKSLTCPTVLVRAARNLLNEAPPLYPDDVVHEWMSAVTNLTDVLVPDTNHYTLMFGERGATTLAAYVRDPRGGARD